METNYLNNSDPDKHTISSSFWAKWANLAGECCFEHLTPFPWIEKLENSKCKLRPQIVTDLTLKTEIQSIAYFSQSGVARVPAGTWHAVQVQPNTKLLQTVLPRSQQLALPNLCSQCQRSRKCDCWVQKMRFFSPMSMDNGGSVLTFVCAATCGEEFLKISCRRTRWSHPGTLWCWPGSHVASASHLTSSRSHFCLHFLTFTVSLFPKGSAGVQHRWYIKLQHGSASDCTSGRFRQITFLP